jgi:hypothetical protein
MFTTKCAFMSTEKFDCVKNMLTLKVLAFEIELTKIDIFEKYLENFYAVK